LDILKYLVQEKGAMVEKRDNNGCTALMYAAKEFMMSEKGLPTIKFFIEECNADITIKDNQNITLLMHCAAHSAIEVMRYLIEEKKMHVDLKALVDFVTQKGGFICEQLIDYLIRDHDLNDKNHHDLLWSLLMNAVKIG